MEYLVDSGVLLRLTEPSDPQHHVVTAAVAILWARGDRLAASAQNMVEFWAVSTRPAQERGGLALQPPEVDVRLRALESIIEVLPDPPPLYKTWRDIVLTYSVLGRQVHDARLAAFMHDHRIGRLLTFNGKDFKRYPWLQAVHPNEIVGNETSTALAP